MSAGGSILMQTFNGAKAAALAAGFIFLSISPASAQPRDSAAQVDALLRCRGETNSEARLRCFDAAAAALDQGITSGAVVAVDAQQTRRRLFGLGIPDFLDGGDRNPAEREMTAKIESASHSGYQRWLITLDNGQVWKTTESSNGADPPRPGGEVKITREALGNHWMRLPNDRRVRVRRDR
jgi:hypothetical protein